MANNNVKYWGHLVLKYPVGTSDAKKKQIRSEFRRALTAAGIPGLEDDYFVGYVADNYVDGMLKIKYIFSASPLLLDYLGGAWLHRIDDTADLSRYLLSLEPSAGSTR